MSNLTNQAPAYTFGALMNTEAAGGLTDILQVIQDGFGHSSPLSLSTDSLKINTQMGGGFFIDDTQLNATATEINSVCVDASFASFVTALTLPKGTTAQRPDPAQNGDIRYNTTTSSTEMYSDDAWVTIGTNSPNFSSFTTAITFPKGTTAQRPAPPENGDMRYNTDSGSFEGYILDDDGDSIWSDVLTVYSGYSPGNPTYLRDTFGNGTFNLSVGSPRAMFTGRFESTIFGDDALQTVGAGSNLVGIGYKCLNLLTTANSVTGVGHLCLSKLTTGIYCTAFGKSSQEINDTGSYNVSMGALSLGDLFDGDSNTAVGHSSLGACIDSSNTAVGRDSGLILILGQGNCFFGDSSGIGLLNGSGNCFIGSNSGAETSSYTNCTFLGKNSGALELTASLTNAGAIGFGAVVGVDNAIVLGDATVPTKVGIGTTSPTQILHVENGNAVFSGMVGVGTLVPSTRLHVKDGVSYFENSNVGIGISNPTYQLHVKNGAGALFENSAIQVSNANIICSGTGNVGIGTSTAPSSKLHVIGEVRFKGIVSTYPGTELIRNQYGILTNSTTPQTLDFPISPVTVGLGVQAVVKITISVVEAPSPLCRAAYATSTAAALWDGSTTASTGTLPTITFTATSGFVVTAVWSISGNNLRLTITGSSGTSAVWVITSETYSSHSSTTV